MKAKGPDETPFDALTSQSKTYGQGRSSVLTPMGEVESVGAFARGLVRRRVTISLAGLGAFVLLLAVLEAAS